MLSKKDLILAKLSGDLFITKRYSGILYTTCNNCQFISRRGVLYFCLYNKTGFHYHLCKKCAIDLGVYHD